MRRLWRDIEAHRLSAGLVVAYWVAVFCLDAFDWRKPPGVHDDIVAPVLFLTMFGAVLAGAVVAWWRRSEPGPIGGGMLAGAVLSVIDMTVKLVPQFAYPGQESILEVPVWLIATGLAGSLLGLAGAAAMWAVSRIAYGRKPEPMPETESEWRRGRRQRIRYIAGALAVAAAAMVVVGVIPPVSSDYYPGAAPGRAVKAFAVNAALNLIVAVLLMARFSESRRAKPVLIAAGFVALLLGSSLLDAAGAFASDLIGAAAVCGLCAAADFSAGFLAFWAVRGA